ncbi:MAG: ClpX C4-type zinc finger protein [Streptosporangiaceae bacterium]
MPDADLACTFCGSPQRKVRKLIAGPGAYICEACVELAAGVVSSGSAASTQLGLMHAVPEQDGRVHCRFCDKHRDRVAGMAAMPAESGGKISGPAAICLECLSLCEGDHRRGAGVTLPGTETRPASRLARLLRH